MSDPAQASAFPPRLRAAIPAILIALALIGAVIAVVLWAPTAGAEPTEVYLESDGARLLVTMDSAAVGAMQTSGSDETSSESTEWAALDVPKEAVDWNGGPVRVAYGETRFAEITDVRLTFTEIRVVINGTMHQLHLEQDTLHIRLDTPGAKGDSLLLVLDGEGSIAARADGTLTFVPRLLASAWGPGKAHDGEAPPRPAARTPLGGDADRPMPGSGGHLIPPPQAAPRPGAPTAPPAPPPVGHIELFMQGRSHGLALNLNATITKIALGNAAQPGQTVTWYEGKSTLDLVAAAHEPVHLLTAQVPTGSYESIHLETAAASVRFSLNGEHQLHIPQPSLVLETLFNVTTGQTLSILIEIGVEDSLRVSLAGLEYRPVVTDLLIGTTERATGLSTLLEPYPAQYRTGGAWLPSLGAEGDQVLADQGLDPGSIQHPIHGDNERPPGSEGSLADPDTARELIDELTGQLPEAPQLPALPGLG